MPAITITVECDDCQVVADNFELWCPYLRYFKNPEEACCLKSGRLSKLGRADLFKDCPCRTKKEGE